MGIFLTSSPCRYMPYFKSVNYDAYLQCPSRTSIKLIDICYGVFLRAGDKRKGERLVEK